MNFENECCEIVLLKKSLKVLAYCHLTVYCSWEGAEMHRKFCGKFTRRMHMKCFFFKYSLDIQSWCKYNIHNMLYCKLCIYTHQQNLQFIYDHFNLLGKYKYKNLIVHVENKLLNYLDKNIY